MIKFLVIHPSWNFTRSVNALYPIIQFLNICQLISHIGYKVVPVVVYSKWINEQGQFLLIFPIITHLMKKSFYPIPNNHRYN